jgi:hypothetical protein
VASPIAASAGPIYFVSLYGTNPIISSVVSKPKRTARPGLPPRSAQSIILLTRKAGALDGLVAQMIGRPGEGQAYDIAQIRHPQGWAIAATLVHERTRVPVAAVAGLRLRDAHHG